MSSLTRHAIGGLRDGRPQCHCNSTLKGCVTKVTQNQIAFVWTEVKSLSNMQLLKRNLVSLKFKISKLHNNHFNYSCFRPSFYWLVLPKPNPIMMFLTKIVMTLATATRSPKKWTAMRTIAASPSTNVLQVPENVCWKTYVARRMPWQVCFQTLSPLRSTDVCHCNLRVPEGCVQHHLKWCSLIK